MDRERHKKKERDDKKSNNKQLIDVYFTWTMTIFLIILTKEYISLFY